MGLDGVCKRRWSYDLDLSDNTLAFMLGSVCFRVLFSSLVSGSDPVVFCWSYGSRSSAYFAIGVYLLCCDYSIAYFPLNCNHQNIRSLQNIFVDKIEKRQSAENLLQFVFRCAIIVFVVVSLADGRPISRPRLA